MVLRKINAGLGLLSVVLLMNHAVFHAARMLSRGGVSKPVNGVSWVLFGLMMVHAVLSIVLAVRGHKGAEKRKCNGYFKLNAATNVQRFGGILLILFTVLHIAGTVGVMQPPQVVHAILPPVFFTVALIHTAISTGKALITLGIGSAKFIKAADIAVKVLCGVTLIADIVGFYLFVC